MEPKKLDDWKDYAEFILTKLDLVPPNISKEEDWIPSKLDECVVQLRNAAAKTITVATSPVKIGVMGEFSSGKTLLLGSLIGYADALPISENPTTGNVTAIHLLPQDGFTTTHIESYTVQYLDQQGAQECLNFILQVAVQRARAVNIPPPTTTELNRRGEIIDWCRKAWESSTNLELRYSLRELISFIRAEAAYGEAMYGKRYKLDPVPARDGLQLASQPMAIQTISFEDLPPAPIRLPNAPQNLAPRLLQNGFPLIRRVDVEVKISREIWAQTNLSEGVAEFVLLDFPGLGAANSGARDTFLSLRELAEVQTILVLLNGKTPGSDRAHTIFTMMQQQRPGQELKDLILVGVGRFDQLPLDSEGGERELDKLISDTTPITETEVFRSLPVLQTIIDGAKAFTNHPERIILLSPLLGLAELAKRSTTVKVGSLEFIANLEYPDYLERSKRLQEKWGLLSQRLLKSDPRSHLGKQLGYFAQDGSIIKLRELIHHHLDTHGVKQLYQDIARAGDDLRQKQNYLKDIIAEIHQTGIPATDSPALLELRAAIENLDKIYRNFQRNVGKEPLKDMRGVLVTDVVKDELIFRVINWHQWTLLFNKVHHGTITLGESQGAAGKLFGSRKGVDGNLPTKSEDFYGTFTQSMEELQKFARDRIYEAVGDTLKNLSYTITSEREYIQNILTPEVLTEIETKFGVETKELFKNLLLSCDPYQWLEAIQEETHTEPPDSANIFPLPLPDAKHNIGQIFDWAPRKTAQKTLDSPQLDNHQMFVLRLRDEITATASLHLVQYVSEINQRVNGELMGILDQVIPILQNISKQEDLLRYLAGANPDSQRAIPNWLQTLSSVSQIS